MKATYDDNLLRAYLLGTLPEAEVERCDELSFIDDDFVAQLQVVEDDLVDAYVQNELPQAERAPFEAHYLASPRRQEKVRFARSFQAFAEQQLAASTRAPAITPAPVRNASDSDHATTSWWQSLRNLFTLPNLTMQWGMAAAALLLLLVGGWFWAELQRLRGQIDATQTERATLQKREQELQTQLEQQRNSNNQNIEQLNAELKRTQQQLDELKRQQELASQQARNQTLPEAPNILHVELTPQTRGIGRTTELPLAATTDFAVLQLIVPEDDYQAYQAEVLTQADEKVRWKSGRLKARPSGSGRVIDVSVRARFLPPGNYVVRLSGFTTDGQTEEIRKYSFKVVRPS